MKRKMSAGNPGYSPLPQSNSDSDGSEEELHVSQGNKFTRGVVVSKPKTFTELKKNVINYKPLDDERHVEETLTKFQSGFDEVVIQKSNSSERFSTCRKICFIFSLFLCVFTTIAFLWILPCDIESCPVVVDMSLGGSDAKSDNYTWKKILPNLEIIGPCSLISDSFSTNQNIVFLAKNYTPSNQNNTGNFLLSLKGKDGSLNWKERFERELIAVDCRLIDIDLNGLNDCLLFGRNYLTAINSLSGKEIWIRNDLEGVEPIFTNFPVVLPDINNDNVKDLLVSYSLSNHSLSQIVIISGKTSESISKPYQIKFCKTFYNLQPLNGSILSYTCHNLSRESVQTINLTDVFKIIGKVNFSNWEKLHQHKEYSSTVSVNNLQLVVENKGHCPETCSAFVKVKDESKLGNKSIYRLSKKNSFGMTPIELKSKHLPGFILKFWEWKIETEKLNFQNNTMCSKQSFGKCQSAKQISRKNKLSSATNLDNEMLYEDERIFKRDKRTADNSRIQENGTNLRLITETLVKLTFNDTHVNVSHLYKDEIIQICQKSQICHPNEKQQMHSSLVGFFNGSEKVVIFSSENVINSKNESWQMQSKIQMLNCE